MGLAATSPTVELKHQCLVPDFYLGVWNGQVAISDDEAAARHLALIGEKSAEPEFDARVYTFYCRLTSM